MLRRSRRPETYEPWGIVGLAGDHRPRRVCPAAVEREARTVGLDRRRLRILDLAEVQQETRRLAATDLAVNTAAPGGAR